MRTRSQKPFFKKNPYRGVFIDIEGLDGSGESTQVQTVATDLRAFLKSQGSSIKVFTTKEPTDNVIGGLIRGALTGIYQLEPLILQLLFAADRGHHIQRLIRPMLQQGYIVITDRYFWSSVAFGGLAIDQNLLLAINRGFIIPDFSFLLNVPPTVCAGRVIRDRYDIELFETGEKLQKVSRNYERLVKDFPKDITVVDGNAPIDVVTASIMQHILRSSKFRKLIKK